MPLKSSRFKNQKSKCQWFNNQRCKSQQFQWFKNQMRAWGFKNIPRSKETIRPWRSKNHWRLKNLSGFWKYMRPLVKEKCVNMVIKMSLRYCSIGRFPLMMMPNITTPCGLFWKGGECYESHICRNILILLEVPSIQLKVSPKIG